MGDIEFTQQSQGVLTVGHVNAALGSVTLTTHDGDLHLIGSVAAGGLGDVRYVSSARVVLDGDTVAEDALISINAAEIRGLGHLNSRDLALRAEAGIGTNAPLNSAVQRVAAINSDSGSIQLSNSVGGLLTVAEVDGVVGVLNQGSISPGGDILITNQSPLTIDQIVGNSAGGDVVLTAFNDGGQDDHLRVNARVFASGGDGSIYLNAGSNLIINDSGLLSQNPLVPPSSSTLGQADISVTGGGIVQGSVGGQIVIGGDVLIESQTGAIADVPPRLSRVVLDSDYDARLESSSATIRGQYGRVGERNFVLIVSWGDGSVENFARESAGEFAFTHDYLGGSFNQIPVTVTLVDDFNIQLGSGSVSVTEIIAPTLFVQLDDEDEEDEQAQSMFLSTIELDLGGIGRRQFDLIDQESTQPLMEQSTNVVNAVDADEAFISERSVFLVVLSPDGSEKTRVPMSESDLNDLPALFYKLPDGRYQVLIRDAGEQRERLLRDVDVRNHIATDVRQEYRSDELQEQPISNPIDQPSVT
ncbi:MAG: hypothetical protein ABGZ17_24210, partial [Planctomycetaceae bacterium]